MGYTFIFFYRGTTLIQGYRDNEILADIIHGAIILERTILSPVKKGKGKRSKQFATSLTATGIHVPCRIKQCYLPPGRGDIPALTTAEAGTRFSDPGGMQG